MEKLVNQPIKNGGWISNFFRINIYHDCLSWTIESMNFTSTICTFPSKLSEDPKLKSLREDTFPLEEICLQVKKVLKKTYTMKITPKNYQLQIKPTFQANKKHPKKKNKAWEASRACAASYFFTVKFEMPWQSVRVRRVGKFHPLSHEKKKSAWHLSIESWLVNSDPYFMVS